MEVYQNILEPSIILASLSQKIDSREAIKDTEENILPNQITDNQPKSIIQQKTLNMNSNQPKLAVSQQFYKICKPRTLNDLIPVSQSTKSLHPAKVGVIQNVVKGYVKTSLHGSTLCFNQFFLCHNQMQ